MPQLSAKLASTPSLPCRAAGRPWTWESALRTPRGQAATAEHLDGIARACLRYVAIVFSCYGRMLTLLLLWSLLRGRPLADWVWVTADRC